MRAPSSDPKTRENRLRREALRQGLFLAKSRGEDTWFLYDGLRKADSARVYYSLDEVEAALSGEGSDEEDPDEAVMAIAA
jgi:hypothetical protein